MNDHQLKKLLQTGISELGIDKCFDSPLWHYLELLSQWNKSYNLTAIKDLRNMITHHVFDSLSVYPFMREKTIIDVGTGGGLPGLVLAIVDPERSYTLLDSVGKKTRFLREVKRKIGLNNVNVIHQRVQNYSPDLSFDVIISRAFSSSNDFLNWTSHLGDENSHFLAMKGPKNESESIPNTFALESKHSLDIPHLDAQRNLFVFKKVVTK